jgi:DNA-binding transcriptional LysR family regulator
VSSDRGATAANLTQIEVFCRVVETGGFTAAAESLHVTQPAVSMHVHALEAEYRVRLLERRGDGVVLTAAGRVLYRRARTMLRARAEAERELALLSEGGPRPLVLGASSTGVAYYLPPLVRAFAAADEAVRVVLRIDVTDRVIEAVVAGDAALAAVWGPVRRADLRVSRVGRDRFVVIAPPGHPLLGASPAGGEGVPVDAARLAGEPFVLGMPGTTSRRFVEDALLAVGLVPRVAAEVASSADMKRAVEDGVGLSVVSRKAVEVEVAAGRVGVLDVAGLQLWREVDLVLPRRRSPGGAAERLAAFLAAKLPLPDRTVAEG